MAKDTTGRLHVTVKSGGKRKLSSKLWLERPFGSVRWKEDPPDRAANEVLPVVASAAGSTT